MAGTVTQYECPACTGPLHFDEQSGKLICDYCGSRFAVEEIEALNRQKDAEAADKLNKEEQKKEEKKQKKAAESKETAEEQQWDVSDMEEEWETKGLRAYECPACGAQLMCDETTAATSCPYCGNPTIVPGKMSGALKPDFIIPFKVTKEAAIEALRKHYKGKKLLPNVFAEENHIQKIQGVYVPFWLFDGKVDADCQYTAEIVHTYRSGKYEVTEIDYFDVERAGTVEFSHIPTDASRKMDDALMDSIEPFDYSEMKPYSNAYLPGYLADRYDVSVNECMGRADTRAKNTAARAMRDSISGYAMVAEKSKMLKLNRGKVHYALLPVWVLNTKWNDKQYIFAMNGQTGKFVGDLPIDKKKCWKYRLIYGGLIGAAMYALTQLCTLVM